MNQLKSKNWIFVPRDFEELYRDYSQLEENFEEDEHTQDLGMRICSDYSEKIEDVYVKCGNKGKPVDSIHCCTFYDN